MPEAILIGVSAFIATNIDDILLLTLYFSQVNEHFRKRHIVAGQYLGFGVLLVVSLLVYMGTFFIPEEWIGLLGFAPIAIGVNQLIESRKPKEEGTPEIPITSNNKPGFLTHTFSPQTLKIAAVTIANGGDNIGIYVPLFTALDDGQVPVVVVVFLCMVAVWLWISYKLGNHPLIRNVILRYAHIIVPLFLIGLGVFILVKSGTAALILEIIFAG